MIRAHQEVTAAALGTLIRSGEIAWGGNRNLKVYGTLTCASGKRLKRPNRVFFTTAAEAQAAGYRPCGHCLPTQYRAWKAAQQPATSAQESD